MPALYREARRRGTPFTLALLGTALAGPTSLSRVPGRLTEEVLLPLVRPGGVTRKRSAHGAEPVRVLLDLPREQAKCLMRRGTLPARALIDLDSAAYAPDRTAFRSWVRDLLCATGSVFDRAGSAAGAAADAITARSWPDLLLAETLAAGVRARGARWVPDGSTPLPTSLEDAWQFLLSSFGEPADEVGRALTAVALAEGASGMPASLAARAVSALGGQPIAEDALPRVIAAAAALVTEETVATKPGYGPGYGPGRASTATEPSADAGGAETAPAADRPSGPGRTDTGRTDSEPSDTGRTDADPPDTEASDAEPSDTEPSDAGPSASGPSAAGPSATGSPDSPFPASAGRVRHLRLRDPALAAAARRSYGSALPGLQHRIATALAPRTVLTDAELAAPGAEPLSPEAAYVLGPGLAHAAAGGLLDEWIAAPALAFLVDLPSFEDADGHAAPASRPDGRARRRSLGQAQRLYAGPRSGQVPEHASRLGLTASVCDDTELADWLLRSGVPRVWRTHWSHWRPLGVFEPAEFDGEWPGPVALHGWRSVGGVEQFCTRSELSGRYQWWVLADGTPVGDASTEPPPALSGPSGGIAAPTGPREVVLGEHDPWVGVRAAGGAAPDATVPVCPEGHVSEVHPLSAERALLLGRSGVMLIGVAPGRPGERALPPRPRRLTSWWITDDALYGDRALGAELLAPLFALAGRPVRAEPEHLGPLASLPGTARLLTEVGLPASGFWFEGLDRFVPTLPHLTAGDGNDHAEGGQPQASVIGYVGDDTMQLCIAHGSGHIMVADGGTFVCRVNSSLDAFLRCWTVALTAIITSNARDAEEEDEFRAHMLRLLGRIDPTCVGGPEPGRPTTKWPQLLSDSTYLLE